MCIARLLSRFVIREAPKGATKLKIVNGTVIVTEYEDVLVRFEERSNATATAAYGNDEEGQTARVI